MFRLAESSSEHREVDAWQSASGELGEVGCLCGWRAQAWGGIGWARAAHREHVAQAVAR